MTETHPGTIVRVRTNVVARLPDPEGKFRDTFERTIELETSEYLSPNEGIKHVIDLCDDYFKMELLKIQALGGRIYSLEEPKDQSFAIQGLPDWARKQGHPLRGHDYGSLDGIITCYCPVSAQTFKIGREAPEFGKGDPCESRLY